MLGTIGQKVIVIEDCRPGAIATGQTGTYKGEFDTTTGQDRNAEPWLGNPVIQLQDGSIIWGCECWWTPVESAGPLPEMQADLEEHKVFLRELMATIANEMQNDPPTL